CGRPPTTEPITLWYGRPQGPHPALDKLDKYSHNRTITRKAAKAHTAAGRGPCGRPPTKELIIIWCGRPQLPFLCR
ncbi:MAG: hypothetical protein PUG12_02675, partial [Prevotella sp.]|nr:hypothetical protein [Prevotella sp.]